MPVDSYEYAIGYDQVGGFVNFETTFKTKPFPLGKRVPLGAVTRTVMSGKQITDGAQIVTIAFSGVPFSELQTYITAVFTDYNTENREITLGMRRRNGNFAYYNAIAHLPLDGINYQHVSTEKVVDLVMEFYLVEAL